LRALCCTQRWIGVRLPITERIALASIHRSGRELM
jgi:hypothetical protein